MNMSEKERRVWEKLNVENMKKHWVKWELYEQVHEENSILIKENTKLKARWEELKVRTTDIYHKLEKLTVWSVSPDELCEICEGFFHKKMHELEKESGGEVQRVKTSSTAVGEKDRETESTRLGGTPKPEKKVKK